MLMISIILFAVAALGGLAMAYIHFKKDKNPPAAIAVLHGLFAATALVILALAVIQMHLSGPAAWALGLFVVAALGGFFLMSYHMRGQRLPSKVVVIHAVAAVVAFLLLLVGVTGSM
jgi:hypothetical protein